MNDTGKKDGPLVTGREKATIAAAQGGDREHTEFPADARGLPIFDAAGLEVLKAWRYFCTVPGDIPAMVAALLVIAWAIKGRL
jgi:hypothetical protein